MSTATYADYKLRLGSALSKERVFGVAAFITLLTLFLIFNRLPKLDIVETDLAAAASPTQRCFQGFCVDANPESSLLSRVWSFSLSYLQIVLVGMVFAFLVAGLTETFILPQKRLPGVRGAGFRSAIKGIAMGMPMTLCSACIVPFSSALRRKGADVSATISTVQASSTLNLPALIMVVVVFAPMISGSRIALSLLGALALGPMVALIADRRRKRLADNTVRQSLERIQYPTWADIFTAGVKDWMTASFGYLLRLGPVMVLAGIASGFVIQVLNPDLVETYLGDHLLGVVIAALVGVLINVPLMFEIPLVAALLLVGMGTGPATALLFTAAAGGPITFWGLARVLPRRGVAALGIGTWVLGALGGMAVLGIGALSPSANLGDVPGLANRRAATLESGQHSRTAGGPLRFPHFVDVTASSGISYVQYHLKPHGSCLLDGGIGNSAGRGQYCSPERMSGGAAAADYDNDGLVDLFVTRLDAPDILYRNVGHGKFEDRTGAAGLAEFDLRSNGALWSDIDNDGDQDLYVTTIADKRFYLFINNGNGRFTEEGIERGAAIATDELHIGYSIATGDYDRDGWLDLHVTEWGSDSVISDGVLSHARLLRNRGAEAPGYFTDVTAVAGVQLDDVESQALGDPDSNPMLSLADGAGLNGPFAFASAFTDLDGDGWPDLAIASDFGQSRLFWNNRDGTFTDGSVAARIGTDRNGMGSTFGDYDADGDLDWFVTSIMDQAANCEKILIQDESARISLGCRSDDTTGNRLYRNDGNRLFSDATDSAGVRDGGWGWGAVFLDYDNDGDLDLAMVNGMAHSAEPSASEFEPSRLWLNDGSGAMTEVGIESGLPHLEPGKGILTFDYDGDGDLDLFIVNNGSTPRLYRNDGGNANSWLRIRLVGTNSNSSGIGAKVSVTPRLGDASQVREIGVRSHFLGQSELTEHFGLGPELAEVAEVRIWWPRTGQEVVLRDIPANETIVVHEGRAGYTLESSTAS
ncbi:MAG: FG-GAP-like repeat-containing protein [Chloroflexi bacterium]|nr:FG-GAP-like repeat-containing protein [Chloroflexota bacterium]